MAPVFVAVVEVRPREGCDLVPRDCAGAFLRCYVQAIDREAALATLTADLESEHCHILATEWCTRRDELPSDKDDENGNECEQEARKSGQVIIGRTDGWLADPRDR
jgi:hypothetical protein